MVNYLTTDTTDSRPNTHPLASIEIVGLVLLFLLALSLRLLYLRLQPQTPVIFDALSYYELGRSLLTGQVSDTLSLWGTDIWPLLGSRGPIYPLFLAGLFSVFDVDSEPVRYVQAGLGALSCLFIYLIGRELISRLAGLIAGLMMALYPSLILFTGRILTETVAIFLFWAGVWLFVRSLRRKNIAWIITSGLVIGLACLTRPTLLPTVPFLVAAFAIGVTKVTMGQRALLAAIFGVSLFGLLLSWNIFARAKGTDPTVGAAGIDFIISDLSLETNPAVRGWRPDERSQIDPYWWQNNFDSVGFIYPVAAILNLTFYHLWFADNAWQEQFLYTPAALLWFQRIVVILGLGGLGVALTQWRTYAPLLAVMLSFGIVSLKVIEIRHNLPFMPACFLLASLFLVSVLGWIKEYRGRTGHLIALGSGIILNLAFIFISRAVLLNGSDFILASISPITLGILSDVAVLLLSLLIGWLIYYLSQHSMGHWGAIIAGFMPAVLFMTLFGAYIHTGSEPRWQAWNISLDQPDASLVQQITLPQPISTDQLELVVWLIDLQTNAEPPPLRVGLNGTWLAPELYAWQRLFCTQSVFFITTIEATYCPIYEEYANFRQRALNTWPQWWGVVVDPNKLVGKKTLSLALAREEGTIEISVALGGAFSNRNAFYGPSIYAPSTGEKTSIYRWLVAGDWRLWETTPLNSIETKSYLNLSGSEKILLSGDLNIRLIVKYRDGRIVIY